MKPSRSFLLLLLSTLAAPVLANAQPAPVGPAVPETRAPSGPAEVLTAPAPSTTPAAAELPPGHAPVSEEQLRRVLGEGPPLAHSEPSAEVPARSVRVRAIDENGLPLANTRVRLGSMVEGRRDERFATTDATGQASFADLPAAGRIAYRVSLDHQGARTLTAPFTLAADRGQQVFLRRMPTTRERDTLLQRIGQTVIEWKAGRARISQAMDLMNLGDRTVVFGSPGLAIPLPEGFLAFESQPSMNDQRIVPDEQGFRIEGSLPPGHVELSWTFDVPLSGDELVLRQTVPFEKTAVYRVIVDASDGMELDVRGFPEARWVESSGKRLLYTEAERGPDDPPFGELRIRLRGIPSPGPWRFIAIGLSVVVLGFGVFIASRRGAEDAVSREERARHREALLEEMEQLARDHQAGEVGEQFYARERERIVLALALLAKRDAAAT